MNLNIYRGKKVLITGHTGFKGSWLAQWLDIIGAEVLGYALAPNTEPSHFALLNLKQKSVMADVCDSAKLESTFAEFQPEIVFHMAAQPLVLYSYREPVETYRTNVMGSLHLFEACRKTKSVRAIVNVTSDKCYENNEWEQGYKEADPMGGHDIYSSSKGCSELLSSSYRRSFFPIDKYAKDHECLLASARAGNVVGGGDWAEDRLIPDIMKAISLKQKMVMRNPHSTRPWQHVLEPLNGYLVLGAHLLNGESSCATGWNFGPKDERALSVKEVVEIVKVQWPSFEYEILEDVNAVHEAHLLRLDVSKAKRDLGWSAKWTASETLQCTTQWYRDYFENRKLNTQDDISLYMG